MAKKINKCINMIRIRFLPCDSVAKENIISLFVLVAGAVRYDIAKF